MPPVDGVEIIGPIVKPGAVGVPDATLRVVLFPSILRGPVIVEGERHAGLTMTGLAPKRLIGGVRLMPHPIVRAGGVEPVFVRVKGPVPVTVPPVLAVRLPIVLGNVDRLRFPSLFTTTLLAGPI
jgi:hypothetical protein